MSYIREELIIQRMFGTLYQKAVRCNVILAGGAIRALFAREEIKDFDLFFRDPIDLAAFEEELLRVKAKALSVTDNAKTYQLDKHIFQLITKINGAPEEILQQFDMTVCKGAYSFAEKSWYFDSNFFQDLAGRRISFSNKLKYPFATFCRAFKYQAKGYYISPVEMVKLVIQCNAIKCDTIYEWKEQLLGIDTVILNELFNAIKADPATQVDAEQMLGYMESFLGEHLLEDEL